MNTKSASDLRGSVGTGRSGDEGGIRQRERRVRFSGARVAAPHHHPALGIENFCQLAGNTSSAGFLQGFDGPQHRRELGGESARERGMKIIAIGAEWV